MTFEIKEMGTLIRLPVFSACEETGRENDNAQRMNRFYATLAAEIAEYTASDEFPQGAKYRADSVCTEDGDDICATVHLSLHHRGRCVRRGKIRHVWQDGVIVDSDGAGT